MQRLTRKQSISAAARDEVIWKMIWQSITDPATLRSIASGHYYALPLAQRQEMGPPDHAIDALCRKIIEGDEPDTYQDREGILKHMLSFRLIYDEKGEVVIEGKIPVGKELVQ